MADPKTDPKADRIAELEAENTRLKGDLAAASTRRPYVAAVPQLTEGDRLQAEQLGYATVGGVVYTRDELVAKLKEWGQEGVTIGQPAPAQREEAARLVGALRQDKDAATSPEGIRGFTHVWPSVAPGRIDPTVAGLPGVNGPSA